MMLVIAYILVNILLGVLYNEFDKHSKIEDYAKYKAEKEIEKEK